MTDLEAFQRVRNTFEPSKTELLYSFMDPFNNGYIRKSK